MKLRRHNIWPFAIILVVYLASGRSNLAAPEVGFSYDKIVHFLVFGLLATTIIRIPRFISNGWKGVFITVLLVSTYGILDEFRQSFTAGRSVDPNDWIADTSGAILASVLYLKWNWYRQTLESPCFNNKSQSHSSLTQEANI